MPGDLVQFIFEFASRKIPLSRVEFCWYGPVFGSKATTVGVQNYVRVLKICESDFFGQLSINAKVFRFIR